MIALLILQLVPGLTTGVEPQADILVTAKLLNETYAKCLNRQCTPVQDAQVMIAVAEQRLREGKYVLAKEMLAKSVARNRKFEKTFPRSLAALYNAYGTVAFHEGDTEQFQRATSRQVGVLRRNLPRTDPSVVYATIQVGDMWVKLKRARSAETSYAAAEKEAREQGQGVAALAASLRRVSLMTATGRMEQAETLLAAVEQDPQANEPAIRTGVQVARARLGMKRGNGGNVDSLVNGIAPAADGEPVLVQAPALSESAADHAKETARRFLTRTPGDDIPSGIEWVDVGFRVRPDGKTDQIAVLRGTLPTSLTRDIVAKIAARRYAASSTDTAGANANRLERYTYRGTYRVPINSRIRRRWGAADMTVLDLSDTPPPASEGKPAP
ncbi:tetratricopeptide repeat protein [Sphingomonas prati]|uniref:Tetratricopeptide repeat protein n=1 Tax=Sphingomonas prati TaxID=1843237 RepID=A0A7W9BVA1_9SPHN|nr:hypothetical protein [Sphingomonas prati]MBB5730645.1 hypothetical protein [Sphingomonas prati]GGE96326.1 hypothetical protein GCM10011404_31820 [Sphingomonas prati]